MLFEQLDRGFVVGGQEDLGPRADGEELVGFGSLVFFYQRLGLAQDDLVEHREVARVVANGVLYKEDDADLAGTGVVLDVAQILDIFDHGDEELGVAVPDEDAVDRLEFRPAGVQPREAGVVGGQQEDGDVRPDGLHFSGESERAFEFYPRHDDDQVVDARTEEVQRGFRGVGAVDAGHGAEVELEIFAVDLFGEDAVGFDDEGIVEASDQEDFAHPPAHEVVVDVAVAPLAVEGRHKFAEVHEAGMILPRNTARNVGTAGGVRGRAAGGARWHVTLRADMSRGLTGAGGAGMILQPLCDAARRRIGR